MIRSSAGSKKYVTRRSRVTYFLPPARELFGSSLDENLLFWLPAHCHTNRYLCVCDCVCYIVELENKWSIHILTRTLKMMMVGLIGSQYIKSYTFLKTVSSVIHSLLIVLLSSCSGML